MVSHYWQIPVNNKESVECNGVVKGDVCNYLLQLLIPRISDNNFTINIAGGEADSLPNKKCELKFFNLSLTEDKDLTPLLSLFVCVYI